MEAFVHLMGGLGETRGVEVFDRPRGRHLQGEIPSRPEHDRILEHRRPETESAVDGGFADRQGRDRDATLAGFGQRRGHERAKETLAAMRCADGHFADLQTVEQGTTDVEGSVPLHERGHGKVARKPEFGGIRRPRSADHASLGRFDLKLMLHETVIRA